MGRFFYLGAGKPWRGLAYVVGLVAVFGCWAWPTVCCPAACFAFRELAKWCLGIKRQAAAQRVGWWEWLAPVSAYWVWFWRVVAVVAVGLSAQYAYLWVLSSFGQLSPAVGAMGVATDGAATAMAIVGEAAPPMATEVALVPV